MMQQAATRNSKTKAVFALMLAAFLAACSVVPKGPPTTGGPPPVDPNGPSTGLPSDGARHRIALLVPMTGSNAGVGEAIANAATMAVLDTGGKTVRITTYDTATGAAAAAQKALADGNKLILGPLLAEDVRAVAPIGRAARVPLIAFSNDVSVAGAGTYLLGFVPTQSVARVVGYAKAQGVKRFAGLVPSGLYGQRASAAFVQAVEANGGQLVGVQTFDRNPGSIQTALRKLPAGGYDSLLIADSGRVALQVVPFVRRAGNANARILGTELWNTEGALSQNPPLHGAWFASVSDSYYNQLANKYRARFGKAPFRLSSIGYDAVLLVNKVAAKWRVGSPFPAGELADPGGFTGIDGAFRFGRDGVAERALEVQQINAGAFSVIAPAPKTFAK
jgi:branched-chain amino acid transport system substrate-binding protein